MCLSLLLSLRRTHSRAPHRECLRRSLFYSIRDSDDARSSIRIVSHRVSSTIGIALMETSASRIEDGVCTSSSLQDTTESDTAAAALQGSPSDVAVVEQQPCVRCKTNSGKNGKHTCEKRRRTGSDPLAPSTRPRRGSAPVVHVEDDPSTLRMEGEDTRSIVAHPNAQRPRDSRYWLLTFPSTCAAARPQQTS